MIPCDKKDDLLINPSREDVAQPDRLDKYISRRCVDLPYDLISRAQRDQPPGLPGLVLDHAILFNQLWPCNEREQRRGSPSCHSDARKRCQTYHALTPSATHTATPSIVASLRQPRKQPHHQQQHMYKPATNMACKVSRRPPKQSINPCPPILPCPTQNTIIPRPSPNSPQHRKTLP